MANPIYNTAPHRAAKRQFRKQIDSGYGWCAEIICLESSRHILPGARFDAAHDRSNPGRYLGPAHPRCNRSEGGREKHKRAKNPRRWLL